MKNNNFNLIEDINVESNETNQKLVPTVELDYVYDTWHAKIENNNKLLLDEYKVLFFNCNLFQDKNFKIFSVYKILVFSFGMKHLSLKTILKINIITALHVSES